MQSNVFLIIGIRGKNQRFPRLIQRDHRPAMSENMCNGMKMSSVLGSSNRACADIKLENVSLLGTNPKQESSIALRESRTKLHARYFRILDAHILCIQIERRHFRYSKVVYLDMMVMAHNHMRTGERDASRVRMHMDFGLGVSVPKAKRGGAPRGCTAIRHQVDGLNFLVVFVTGILIRGRRRRPSGRRKFIAKSDRSSGWWREFTNAQSLSLAPLVSIDLGTRRKRRGSSNCRIHNGASANRKWWRRAGETGNG